MSELKVAVVGTCASGKTSVVAALKERGIDAWAVAQEHSAIPDLWRHLNPDRLVMLDVTLETIRRRRDDARWPAWIYQLQRQRLANAREHADIIVSADDRTIDEIVSTLLSELQRE